MERIREPKERPLEPPEPSVVCECDVCGQDIYDCETYWDIEGDIVCSDCLRDYAEDYFSCYQKKHQKQNRVF